MCVSLSLFFGSGLLAGLYEFPSFPKPAEPPTPADLLASLFPSVPKPPTIVSLKPLDTVFHQFSHISMTYHVSHLILSSPNQAVPPQGALERSKWLRGKEEVAGLSMGTGGKNCWALLEGKKGKAKPKPKPKPSAGSSSASSGKAKKEAASKRPGVQSITSFFKPIAKKSLAAEGVNEGEDDVEVVSPPVLRVKEPPLPSFKRKNPPRAVTAESAEGSEEKRVKKDE